MRSKDAISLSVIVPVYNGAGWIGQCLEHIGAALTASPIRDTEIIVVDDGSTDDTAAEALRAGVAQPVRVIEQPNRGRFLARQRGLTEATKDFVLFVDTRVLLDLTSLAFVNDRVAHSGNRVWTAHVVAATGENRFAGFWQAIEHIAWRRYWRRPRPTSYGIEEFDFFPKGTTALLGPRALLEQAFDAFEPSVSDWSKVNDDTAVLRWVAEREPINIAPAYSCTYHARGDVWAFLRHSYHRGAVLIDGYLRPGTRFAKPISIVLVGSPVVAAYALVHPVVAVGAVLGGSLAAGVAARVLGAKREDAVTFGVLVVPFGIVYLAGMYRGAWLRIDRRVSGTGRAAVPSAA